MVKKAPSFRFLKKKVDPGFVLFLAAIEGVNFQFSESGEDIILQRVFKNKVNGFYVDIGAFRPVKYSNTYLLHRFFGWRGINVDASSEAIALFNKERPNDINIKAAVGPEGAERDFWVFNEPATNTLSEENKERQLLEGKKIRRKEKMVTRTLVNILDEYLPENQEIDFLNIDVEGLDFEVLKTNDWEKYRPKVVLIEDYTIKTSGLNNSNIYQYMKNKGYYFFSQAFDTTIYIEKEFSKEWEKTENTSFDHFEKSWMESPELYQRANYLMQAHPEWNNIIEKIDHLNRQLINEKQNNDALIEQLEKKLQEVNNIRQMYISEKSKHETLDKQLKDLHNDKISLMSQLKLSNEMLKKELDRKQNMQSDYHTVMEENQKIKERMMLLKLETAKKIEYKDEIIDKLQKELYNKQQRELEHLKESFDYKSNELNVVKKKNEHVENMIVKKDLEILQLKEKLKNIIDQQKKFKKKVELIESSRSWRYMEFARKFGSFIRGKHKRTESKTFNKEFVKHVQKKKDTSTSFTKKKNTENKNQRIFKASSLEDKLWGGFSTYAVADLENLKQLDGISKSEKAKAAWSLMRWYYVNENYEEALKNIDYMNKVQPKPSDTKRIIAKVNILVKLKEMEKAKEILRSAINKKGYHPDLYLAMVNVGESEAEKLEWYNKVLVKNGYAPLLKKSEDKPLKLANIITEPVSKINEEDVPKVSIIIPAYNAGDTIQIALESLIAQTWSNIEIVVVDDCSTDNTADVVTSYLKNDPRIKLIRKEQNEGAYAARNTGLQYVTGEFITVHDSDDWSHPQKIESQMRALLSTDCKCVLSYWVRVLEDMTVNGPWFPKGTYFEENLSSLIIHKDVFDEIGVWDQVRVAGDTEFLWRMTKYYGEESVLKHEPKVPLSFSLRSDTSLTRTKATHARTVKFGLRRIYRESAAWWHENTRELYIPPSFKDRKFFAPNMNYPYQIENTHYDVIVVSDFNMLGGAFVSTFNYILAAIRLNMKVGIFHWRRYDTNLGKPLNPQIYELASKQKLDILVPGDHVKADLVIVGYPVILQYKIDDSPKIDCKSLVIVVNQMSARLLNGQDVQYDPLIVRKHAKEVFGHEGRYVPISPLVKRLMDQDGRYLTDPDNIWYPMIDTENWCDTPIRWRGMSRKHPVVGRHGRDHYTKWPSDRKKLELAYGVNEQWDVRFLGGAETAIEILGEKPKNWMVYEFDAIGSKEFLADLDFFVHYTHDEYIEEFGRAVMEAMAVGIPVVLPPKFKETFGSAALYAEPEKVGETINYLWKNEDEYLRQAEIGRKFVFDNCSIYNFSERINKLGINRAKDEAIVTEHMD